MKYRCERYNGMDATTFSILDGAIEGLIYIALVYAGLPFVVGTVL